MPGNKRDGHERAHGPYAHGNRWRVVFVGASGASETQSFATIEEANAEKADFLRHANARTLGEAVTEYLLQLPCRESSRVTARHRLVALLQLAKSDRPLSALTPAVAAQLVAERSSAVAFDTAAGELRYAGKFAGWCVARGWLRSNPFDGISIPAPPERSRGKPQLRVNEVRQFLAAALRDTTRESTAVLMALLMGMRAHEIVQLVVRDVDDDCRLVVITRSKTRAGVRTLAVPTLLQDRLRALIDGRQGTELVFPMTRHALHYHVVAMAERAGVPRVTPHGLRGTFASMVIAGGIPGLTGPNGPGDPNGPLTAANVARMMGHNDDGDTARRHYMAPGAEQSAGVGTVERLVMRSDLALPAGKTDVPN